MNAIQDTVQTLLPSRRKHTSKWTSFNAVCCAHNGETADTRGRGGIINSTDGAVSYHCFNCGFKVTWRPGWHLSYKFRKLLKWLGADENTTQRLVLEAVRVKETVSSEQDIPATDIATVVFQPRPLPPESVSVKEWATYLHLQSDDWPLPKNLVQTVDYIYSRDHELLDRYDFYLTEDTSYNLHKRVLIPMYWHGELIGYTARALEDSVKPKYHSSYESNYVFNVDRQLPTAKFVIVAEGPFDAMAVDGVAVLSNNISETQADIIDSLAREVIVVPDFDIDPKGRWSGRQLVDAALEYGWSVSFPVWKEKCKDISEAVKNYGRLFVLKSIIDAKQTSRLKIELMKKKIHS